MLVAESITSLKPDVNFELSTMDSWIDEAIASGKNRTPRSHFPPLW